MKIIDRYKIEYGMSSKFIILTMCPRLGFPSTYKKPLSDSSMAVTMGKFCIELGAALLMGAGCNQNEKV